MRHGIAAVGMLLAGSHLSAWAQDDGWVLVDQGEKPVREIVVVRDATIEDRTDVQGFLQTSSRQDRKAYEAWLRDRQRNRASNAQTKPPVGVEPQYELRTETIYEDPGKPASRLATYHIHCARQLLDVTLTMTFWRQKPADKSENLPEHAPADPLERRVMDFACNGGGEAPGEARTSALTARGYAHLPDVGSNAQDFVWAKVWEAKAPAFSREVMQANMNRSVGELTKTMEGASKTVAEAGSRIKQFQEDADRTKNRIGRSTTLETWINRDEADFVRRFRAPNQFYDAADGTRTLSYHLTETTTSINTQPIGMTATGTPIMQDQTTAQTHGCDFSVQSRDGKIFDYSVTSGDACPRMLNDF